MSFTIIILLLCLLVDFPSCRLLKDKVYLEHFCILHMTPPLGSLKSNLNSFSESLIFASENLFLFLCSFSVIARNLIVILNFLYLKSILSLHSVLLLGKVFPDVFLDQRDLWRKNKIKQKSKISLALASLSTSINHLCIISCENHQCLNWFFFCTSWPLLKTSQ